MAGSGEEPLNRELYRIPGHAGWFSWNEIHSIEHEALLEFFEGKTLSKTPKIYKEYRDFMINKYRENPKRAVTFTEIRKSLIGDVNCLRRVFNFLEKWGLINDLGVQSEGEAPSTSSSTVVVNSAPPGIKIDHKPFASLQAANLSSRDNVYLIKTPGGQQQASPRDEWTQQETLLLLEAVSKHGDNWSRVQQHVGTKSRAQCVKQFIQLPYGDQYLSEDGGSVPETVSLTTTKALENGTAQPPAKKQKVATPQADGKAKPQQQSEAHLLEELGITPFHDATNQVLSQVGLMAAMVGPRVAAAAAQAALNVIAEEEPAVGHLPLLKDPATPAKDHKEQNADSEVDAVTGVTKPEGHSEAPDKENTKLSSAQLRAGLATALAAAAVNAKHKADQEEREIEAQMAIVIETQLRKLYAKLEHFEELEHLMEKERLQLEQMREQVFIDRIQLMRQQFPANVSAASQDKGRE